MESGEGEGVENTCSSFRTNTVALAVGICACLLGFAFDWRLRVFAADDASIHLRIAQHLVTTGHAWYNTGERVMVTSSPLWTVLLAMASMVFHKIPPAIPLDAAALASSCAIASLLAYQSVSRLQLSRPVRFLYLALPPFLTFWILLESTILQMETPAAVALLLAGIYAYVCRSSWWLVLLVLASSRDTNSSSWRSFSVLREF